MDKLKRNIKQLWMKLTKSGMRLKEFIFKPQKADRSKAEKIAHATFEEMIHTHSIQELMEHELVPRKWVKKVEYFTQQKQFEERKVLQAHQKQIGELKAWYEDKTGRLKRPTPRTRFQFLQTYRKAREQLNLWKERKLVEITSRYYDNIQLLTT